MAITKLLLSIVSLVAQLHTFTPPSVRPSTEQLREQHGGEAFVQQSIIVTKIILWSCALIEVSVFVALSGYCPPALARMLLHFLPMSLTSDTTSLTTPTPAFIIGTALILAGSLLRAYCFHALGRHFTFELSIRPAHKLVTHDAYSVVRHPSYTGGLALTAGWLLCTLDPRGAVVAVFAGAFGLELNGTECGTTLTTVLVCAWAAGFGWMSVGVWGRMNREDMMLEKQFGEAWLAWAKRVPYRLIPGVY